MKKSSSSPEEYASQLVDKYNIRNFSESEKPEIMLIHFKNLKLDKNLELAVFKKVFEKFSDPDDEQHTKGFNCFASTFLKYLDANKSDFTVSQTNLLKEINTYIQKSYTDFSLDNETVSNMNFLVKSIKPVTTTKLTKQDTGGIAAQLSSLSGVFKKPDSKKLLVKKEVKEEKPEKNSMELPEIEKPSENAPRK